MRNEAVYEAIHELRRSGRPGVLATVVSLKGSSPGALGSKMLISADGKAVGTVGGGCVDGHVYAELAEVLREGLPKSFVVDLKETDDPDHGLICGGRVEIFLEPIMTTHLVICGSGHVAHALTAFAEPLDFQVTVMDDRPQFLNAERYPNATLLLGEFNELLESTTAPHGAYITIVTRGHRYDQECLEWALRQENVRYIGLIGSRAKIRKILMRARDAGFDEARLAAIRAPVGLDIGAVTVEEIAVAVAAELVAVRRRGTQVSRDLRNPGTVDPRKAGLPPATQLPPRREAPKSAAVD